MKKEKNIKTLRELDRMLPIGLKERPEWSFKPRDNSFKFKDWGFEQEEEISKLKNKETSSGSFATKVLTMMLDELGGQKWDKMGDERILVLSRMAMSDVLYMYIYLRIEALGHEFAFSNLVCPHCNHEHGEFVVDLRDLDVDVLDKDEDIEHVEEYILKKPIKFEHMGSDGKKITEKIASLKLTRSKWSVMEELSGENVQNAAKSKMCLLKDCIVGYNDSIGYVPDEIIKSIKKLDFERLDRMIARINKGPTVVITDDCKNCGKKWSRQINWSYDYFFGSSSLPSV